MRLAAQAKGGYYPTPLRVVDLLAQLIDSPSAYGRPGQTLRVLDPCCGGGDALAQLADGLRRTNSLPIETYGVELHRERAEEAGELLDRALACDLFATSIANGVFGVLLLNPPYDYDSEDKRTEHAFLTHCTRYLADGGLLVFIVPKQRLSVSARYLASHYRDLRCWAFPFPEREAFDQVVLLGYRKAEPSPDPRAEGQIRVWAEGEPEELYDGGYRVYDPPGRRRRGHPLRHPHRGPVGGGGRGPEVGTVGQPGHHRRPLAGGRPPGPSADAAAPGPPGHAGGGGLPGQPGAGVRRAAGCWSRDAPARRRCWPRRRNTPRCTGKSSRPPWWRWTWTAATSPISPPDPARSVPSM